MTITLHSPLTDETFPLLTAAQRALLAGCNTETDTAFDWAELKQKETEYSFPLAVPFSWHTEGDAAVQETLLYLDREPDFPAPQVLALSANAQEAEIDNLTGGRQYFWKVVCRTETGCAESPVGRFFTADEAPVFYRIGDLTNVRDTGGWRTADGGRVRRGMVFRGCELNLRIHLTDEGRRFMHDTLGIRTDLDLRFEAVDKFDTSPIGDDIRYALLPAKPYAEFTAPEEAAVCRAVFSVFADESAYPLYIHCWGGADRTGTVVLLLNALLGVDDESLLLDYELTSFSTCGDRSRNFDLFRAFLDSLEAYGQPDEPLAVKAENYLLAAGVTPAQLGEIRRILKEHR